MRFILLVGFTVAIALLSPPLHAGEKEGDRLDGTWMVKSIILDGKKAPDGEVKDARLVVKKDSYEIFRGDKLLGKGTFKVDASKEPKTIDVQPVGPDGKKMTPVLGVYKLESNTLTVCGVKEGNPRPNDFTCKEGSKRELVVYERK